MRGRLHTAGLVLAVFFSGAAWAQQGPVFNVCGTQTPTFCGGLSTSPACAANPKVADALYVMCPGQAAPALTIRGCVGPTITKESGMFKLACKSWNQYDLVPHK